MTRSLTTNVEIEINTQYRDAQPVNELRDDLDWELTDQETPTKLYDGLGDTSANRQWHDQIGLSSGNSYTHSIDVAGGITDGFGNTLTLSNLKEVLVYNEAVSTGFGVSVGGLASGWVGPEGAMHIHDPHDGITVTAGTDDTITLDSGSNEVHVDVIIIGDE